MLRVGAPFVKKSFVGPPVHWSKIVQKMSYLKQYRHGIWPMLSTSFPLSLVLRPHLHQPNFEFVYTVNVPENIKPAFEFAVQIPSTFSLDLPPLSYSTYQCS